MVQVLFGAVGVLFIVLGMPLSRRQVRPNRWYGLRVEATLSSEKVWYEANAVSGREFAWFGTAFTVFTLVFPSLVALSQDAYALTCAATLVLGTAIIAVRGIRLASHLRDAERVSGPGHG